MSIAQNELGSFMHRARTKDVSSSLQGTGSLLRHPSQCISHTLGKATQLSLEQRLQKSLRLYKTPRLNIDSAFLPPLNW